MDTIKMSVGGIENEDIVALTIGTHNGVFHADEVLAVSLLKYLNDDRKVEVVRTRDQTALNGMDIVVDVGKVYNPETGRFDHHQEECNETFDETCKIPLSSAGMVFKHYGIEIIEKFFDEEIDAGLREEITSNDKMSLENLFEWIYQRMYHTFVKEIDAHDNGVSMIKPEYELPKEAYNYYKNLHLGFHINKLNGDRPSNDKEQMVLFNRAMDLCFQVFSIHLTKMFKDEYYYKKDEDDFRNDFNSEYRVRYPYLLVMKNNYGTWRKHLKHLDKAGAIKFAVYPRNEEKTEWGFSTMQSEAFVNDIDLLSFDKLKTMVSTPEELIFVHKNLFCGSAKTVSSAVEACVCSYDNRPRFNSILAKFTNQKENMKSFVFYSFLIFGGYVFGHYLEKYYI